MWDTYVFDGGSSVSILMTIHWESLPKLHYFDAFYSCWKITIFDVEDLTQLESWSQCVFSGKNWVNFVEARLIKSADAACASPAQLANTELVNKQNLKNCEKWNSRETEQSEAKSVYLLNRPRSGALFWLTCSSITFGLGRTRWLPQIVYISNDKTKSQSNEETPGPLRCLERSEDS